MIALVDHSFKSIAKLCKALPEPELFSVVFQGREERKKT
jgi:hypothetical protein